MNKYLEDLCTDIWYSKFDEISLFRRCLYFLLLPLSSLTGLIAQRRIKQRIKRSRKNRARKGLRTKVALVVVGNITVGGTGKTPLLHHLAVKLSARGCRVGIVARAYGATKRIEALEVIATSSVGDVGDEPLMLWRALNTAETTVVPITVHQQRNKAVALLEEKYQLDLILSDDGLQHYAMPRDIEVIVIDGGRGFGNKKLLPAGPLREPLSRLNSVDYILVNASGLNLEMPISTKDIADKTSRFSVACAECRPLNTAARQLLNHASSSLKLSQEPLTQNANAENTISLGGLLSTADKCLDGKLEELVLLAGTGNPQRFFKSAKMQLQQVDLVNYMITELSFPDHHQFQAEDFLLLKLTERAIIVMTEKDAVKCESFADKIPVPLYSIGSKIESEENLSDLVDSLEALAGERN